MGGDQQVYLSRRRGGLGAGAGDGEDRRASSTRNKKPDHSTFCGPSLFFPSIEAELFAIFSLSFIFFLLTTTGKIKVNLIVMFWIHLLLNPLSSFLGCLCFGRLLTKCFIVFFLKKFSPLPTPRDWPS